MGKSESKHRWPQFTLGSIFVITTVVAVAVSGALGQAVKWTTLFMVCYVVLLVPPTVLFLAAAGAFSRDLTDERQKK